LTYDILLAGLLRFNAFDRVIFLADRMRADGVQYSVQTYNSVINAHLHRSAKLCEPSSGVCLLTIASRNDYMRAAATWLLLEGSGLSPDLNSWNLRLSMCRGRDEMLRIWNKMKELGLPGHHRTYLILFSKTLIKASNWDDILEFYNDMKQKGVEPQKQLLILLVTAAKRYGAPESVKTMIKEVAERVAKQPDNGYATVFVAAAHSV
jgi:pentatricopeptide repeat protein